MENRCGWAIKDALMTKYHDEEWGKPLHDDQKLFEFLILEGMQAGLSWQTILNKRVAFREAFDHFNPEIVAAYDEDKVNELMNNVGIIRNKLKILACINNAKRFMEVQAEYGSFDSYIWKFVDHQPIINSFTTLKEIPPKTALSDAISIDLKKKGFKFIGSTIIYAHLQATGVVNDHLTTCFRYAEILKGY
ncbi:MAG TPA: DNA-3-methyladenine glycosylase I [Prolixibacteraceae bacterium]|jgi:DNA-3-methyladenine glycosylase I|nr:DNA-3-methyladenine glycosylase I [Prolixibacteraceae bacterium]